MMKHDDARPDDVKPKHYLSQLPSTYEVAENEIAARMEKMLLNVADARRADELAAEIGSEVAEAYGFKNGSDEFDFLVSYANVLASKAFPGRWEDYPPE
jgi:hypothetical protein